MRITMPDIWRVNILELGELKYSDRLYFDNYEEAKTYVRKFNLDIDWGADWYTYADEPYKVF